MRKRTFRSTAPKQYMPSSGKNTGLERLRNKSYFPLLRLAIIIGSALILAAAVIFLLIPAIRGDFAPKAQEFEPNEFLDPLGDDSDITGEKDLSALQTEALIQYKTISSAYMCGGSIVFSSSSMKGGVPVYDKLVLFDAENEKSEELKVDVKYDDILSSRVNDSYIVWADSAAAGGGRIMMYDRATGKTSKIKDYAYAVPQLALHGRYLAFMQQAGDALDRLYLFDLEKKEGVTVGVYEQLPSTTGCVQLSDGGLIYSVPYIENDVQKCKICVMPTDGSEAQEYNVGRYAYSPKMDGNYIAFLSCTNGAPTDIYVMTKGGSAQLAESDVLNFDMGSGFLAYTKDENVYIYVLKTGQKYRLNSNVSRGRLASVNGNVVCWYDVTGGTSDVDVLKYAKVVWE